MSTNRRKRLSLTHNANWLMLADAPYLALGHPKMPDICLPHVSSYFRHSSQNDWW